MAPWPLLTLACAVLAASTLGAAHGQIDNQTRFFIVTELGNTFEISGPPPDRLPGFDSAPYLNTHTLDTVLALHASGGAQPFVEFGQAGAVTNVPVGDWSRMSAALVMDWDDLRTPPQDLFAHFLVGELHMRHSSPHPTPYLGPGRVADGSVDILALCNRVNTSVSCVDNRRGMDLRTTYTTDHGHVLDLPATGRTIVHMGNVASIPGDRLEVFFTCPDCQDAVKAHYGWRTPPGSGWDQGFMERGYGHTDIVQHAPPHGSFGPGPLRMLSWGSVQGQNGDTYWHGPCSPTMSLVDVGIATVIDGHCGFINTNPIQAGTTQAQQWKPLTPGWNSVNATAHSFIFVTDPGSGASLQVRGGSERCCSGFDGGIVNWARTASGHPMAAVIHDTDRHLLIIPYGAHVPADHPALKESDQLRWEMREKIRSTPRFLSHSESGDPVYHGLWYDERGVWPPYKVDFVHALDIRFGRYATVFTGLGDSSIDNEVLRWTEYPTSDLLNIVGGVVHMIPTGIMDSEIYDIRNDVQLRRDKGTFIRWDGTEVEREYVRPWLDVQKSPVWETFGVHLPRHKLLIVDMYTTIPIVKPTRLSETYLSSIPCGYPDSEAGSMLWDAIHRAFHAGGYDPELLAFLVTTDHDGPVDENTRLQHVYLASRTYLDYLDGAYLAGDEVHVPVLPNRPYLCTTISPNTLTSQFMVYGLPFSSSYVSLGNTEGTAHAENFTQPIAYKRTVGVQSPRDGTVSLDVTARIGAALSAFGTGTNTTGTNPPNQWMNGTVRVTVGLGVGEYAEDSVDETDLITLVEFDIGLHDIHESRYVQNGDTCYGRFVTMPDEAQYVVKTITTPAELGQHIPITIEMSASGEATVPRGPFSYTPGLGLIVFDGGASTLSASDTVTVTDAGSVDTLELTLNVDGHGELSLDWSTAGGTDVVLVAPSGTEHTMTRAAMRSGTHMYDADVFRGEEMAGIWTLRLDDYGTTNPLYWDRNFAVTSWDLEFTRASGLSMGELCDGTDTESILMHYILHTFVIDVR